MKAPSTVLLVEDCADDVFLMDRAFKKAQIQFALPRVCNGEEAIAYLKGDGVYADREKHPMPSMMLLDLHMPKKSGFDVLEWTKSQPRFQWLRIVVTTDSTSPDDVTRAYALGATSFLVKPSALAELAAMVATLHDFIGIDHFPPGNRMVFTGPRFPIGKAPRHIDEPCSTPTASKPGAEAEDQMVEDDREISTFK